jgi:putative addiction module killer protein
MIEIVSSEEFEKWLGRLRDFQAKTRIVARVVRLSEGNPGDVKSVGVGISEMRVHYGPGYRIYFTEVDGQMIVLLVGGDKTTQQEDIEDAKKIALRWRV